MDKQFSKDEVKVAEKMAQQLRTIIVLAKTSYTLRVSAFTCAHTHNAHTNKKQKS